MPNFHTLTRLHTFKINRLKIQEVGVNVPIVISCEIAQKGSGSISGVVTENTIPVSRRVFLYERDTGILFGQTWSDIDGKFTFSSTKESLSYFAISLDENKDSVQYNLTGQDLIEGDYDSK